MRARACPEQRENNRICGAAEEDDREFEAGLIQKTKHQAIFVRPLVQRLYELEGNHTDRGVYACPRFGRIVDEHCARMGLWLSYSKYILG